MRRLRLLVPALLVVGCGAAPSLPPEEFDDDGGAAEAGSLDALVSDAGRTDAPGSDGSSVDAAPPSGDSAPVLDTGATDASTTDSGAPDASTTDSGATDSGAPDGGSVEAGPTDAGTDAPPPCALPTDGKFHVDPTTGSDATGSGTTGCPVRTITRAIQLINGRVGGALPGTEVRLRNNSTPATGEVFPIVVPANVIVRSDSTSAIRTVEVGAGRTGFSLTNPSSGLTYLTIDGKGVANSGVGASGSSSSATTTLSFVTVTGARNDGIYLESGGLRLGAGVRSIANGTSPTATGLGSGLHVRGGNAVVSVAAGETPANFDKNGANGVLIDGSGTLNASGKPDLAGYPASTPEAIANGTGTITVRQNAGAGVGFAQSAAAAATTSTLGGVVVWKNTGNGVRVYAGSRVSLRDNVVALNGRNGLELSPTSSSVFVGAVDLGTDAAFGKNLFSSNAFASICVDNFFGNPVNLSAKGNLFGTRSCAVTPAPTPATVLSSSTGNGDCSGFGPFDVMAVRTSTAAPTKITVQLASCTDVVWP